jgi:hypothetical protein
VIGEEAGDGTGSARRPRGVAISPRRVLPRQFSSGVGYKAGKSDTPCQRDQNPLFPLARFIRLSDGCLALARGSSPCHRNSVPQSHNVTAGIPGFMGAAQPIPHNVGNLLNRGRLGAINPGIGPPSESNQTPDQRPGMTSRQHDHDRQSQAN